MKAFSTKAIHGPFMKKDPHGALRMPIYDSVAFEYESARDIQLAFEGKKPSHAYSRITNPTVEDFEQRIRLLSGATGVVALSSGMAAISNVILTLAEAGANIITTRFLFGNTSSLFEQTLKPWGLEMRYIDMADVSALEKAIDAKTRIIFLETITNPQLQVADLGAIAAIANRHHIPTVVDGTLTTPYIFNTKAAGVDIEILSSTKYITGGATTIGGLILDNGNFDWAKSPKFEKRARQVGPFAFISALRREVYRNLGACLSPHNAYLQTLGLETMALRVDKSCANAMAIAGFLSKRPEIKKVNYPGLESFPDHAVAKRQFKDKFSGLLTFELESKDECFQFINALKLVRRATNINDNKTLILHPASTIFCEYSPDERTAMGVPDTLIRLSVGIEDIEDLTDDLTVGLEAIE